MLDDFDIARENVKSEPFEPNLPTAQRILKWSELNPNSTVAAAVAALGVSQAQVYSAVRRYGEAVKLRKLTDVERSEMRKRDYEKRRAGIPSERALKGPADFRPGSLAARVRDLMQTEGEWDTVSLATALGEPDLMRIRRAVARCRLNYGKRAPKVTPAQPVASALPVKAPLTEEQMRELPQPAKTSTGKKAWYRLRQNIYSGLYLHMSGEGLTKEVKDSWIGDSNQLKASRAKYPAAKGLIALQQA